MLYKKKSFTVPASTADGSMCREKGHSAADSRGRCLCCGEKIEVAVRRALHGQGPNGPDATDGASRLSEETTALANQINDHIERESDRGFDVLTAIANGDEPNSVAIAGAYGMSGTDPMHQQWFRNVPASEIRPSGLQHPTPAETVAAFDRLTGRNHGSQRSHGA